MDRPSQYPSVLRFWCKLCLCAAFSYLCINHSARASDCGWAGQFLGICHSVDELDNRLAQLSLDVKAIASDATKAIPGERWLRIIDDLNSGDPKARQQAQAYLSSVAGLKIQDASDITNYRLAIGFDYDDTKTFNAHVHTFESPDRLLLENYLRFGPQLDRPTKAQLVVINRDEVRSRLLEVADRVISGIAGPILTDGVHDTLECVNPAVAPDQYCARFRFPEPLVAPQLMKHPLSQMPSFNQMTADQKTGPPIFNKRKSEIREGLADLVLEAISYHEERNITKEMSLDWPILTKRKFAVIFIDKATYDQQPDFKIAMRVNKRDKPDETLAGMPTFVIKKSDFDPAGDNLPLTGRQKEQFYWAVREMTGNIAETIEQVEAMNNLRDALKRFNDGLQRR